jgi:hypothetical protein
MPITPYLLYEGAGAAVEWLGKAVGSRKKARAFRL